MASIKGVHTRGIHTNILPRRTYSIQEFPLSITESKYLYPQGTYHMAILAAESTCEGE